MELIEFTDMSASAEVDTTIPLGTFPAEIDVPVPVEDYSPPWFLMTMCRTL